MLRATKTVHEFNALFKRSRGLPSLLQKSDGPDRDQRNSGCAPEEYSKAKLAIEPSGNGLGRRFLAHFLPGDALPKNDTLQATITAYYQEEWKREGEKLMEQSRLARTSNAPRSGATSRIQPAEPFLSRKQAPHGGISRQKLGVSAIIGSTKVLNGIYLQNVGVSMSCDNMRSAMRQQNERKPRRVQEGWKVLAINLRLGEHAELVKQAEATGISMHRLSKAALTIGLPLAIADLQSNV